MAKSQTQRTREHVARLRKKAHAFDTLIGQLQTVASLEPVVKSAAILELVTRAERSAQLQEGGE